MVMINLPTAGGDDLVSLDGRKGSSYGPCVPAYARKFYTTEKTAHTFVG